MSTRTNKTVYRFGNSISDGHAGLTQLLGAKGANLSEMAALGLPVPPGFIITTSACREYLGNGHILPNDLRQQVEEGLAWLEETTNKQYGSHSKPLLVSVRSGGAQSMPGMMDSILNVGLNDEIIRTLLQTTKNRIFVFDCYRRLIEMYGEVVMGVGPEHFEDLVEMVLDKNGARHKHKLDDHGWMELIDQFKQMIQSKIGQPFPTDPRTQLYDAIGAVFRSWNAPRAISYRMMQGLEEENGTAATIQMMVFGNRTNESASGVAFTRNPSNGEPGLFGEYLPMAQGEDIVGGLHSPQALTEKGRLLRGQETPSFERRNPDQFKELAAIGKKLETRFGDMQDLEFAVDDKQLWLLQTRKGKRTLEAAIRISLDLYDKQLFGREELLRRIPASEFKNLLHPILDPSTRPMPVARGLPASPGAVCGQIAFTSNQAVAMASKGEKIILVRNETNPQDVEGINAASGMLTRRGGMTSHAAVIARAMGRPCVVDARTILIDEKEERLTMGGETFHCGSEITIDGTGGNVLAGRAPLKRPMLSKYVVRFRRLAGY